MTRGIKNECREGLSKIGRRWSNKTFPRTLCVVSTSDETTQYVICLMSNTGHQGVEVWDYFLLENWSFVM